MVQATLPGGFKDTGPEIYWHKKQIIDTLEKHFIACGFVRLETPAVEKLTTLLGKYGNEGEQLIFKVINSGHRSQNKALEATEGLRYDLTVPLSRYIVQHKQRIAFPFKRYQIQRVWRAERPQKGRYREFYQCDIDVIGSPSLFHEASLLVLVYKVLDELGIKDFVLLLNHRELLASITDYLGMRGREGFVCQTLDKLDKIGRKAVVDVLKKNGLSKAGEDALYALLAEQPTYEAEYAYLEKRLDSARAKHALKGISDIVGYMNMLCPAARDKIKLAPTLARGLSYYTGAIFEVKVSNEPGSIVGGGRYDDLTNMFGLEHVSGVGLSFGLARIYDIMKARKLFLSDVPTTEVLVIPMDKTTERQAIDVLTKLRSKGFVTEFYPYGPRVKKILTHANKRKIPWVAMIGEKEAKQDQVSLKDMRTGHQKLCTFELLVETVSANK